MAGWVEGQVLDDALCHLARHYARQHSAAPRARAPLSTSLSLKPFARTHNRVFTHRGPN